MSWNAVKLPRDKVQLGALADIDDSYSLIRMRVGTFEGAAIYSRLDVDGSVTVFFSPLASDLAPELLTRFGATPCDQPLGRVSLLVGAPSDPLSF